MSSPLAIAVVTAVLKDLLNNGMIDNDLAPVGTVLISAQPPDRIAAGATEENRLNLFLYQVSPNLGWRNQAYPSHGATGERVSNPPLALNLHYLLTAYGKDDFSAEILLGYAMDILHDVGILTRSAIRRALDPNNPINVNLIPEDSEGRIASDLADQIEHVKLTPNYLSGEELARLWAAMQSRYRPSMAYQVSTLLIQHHRPAARALPVLRRGKENHGADVQPNRLPPLPTWPALREVKAIDGAGLIQSAVELDGQLVFEGVLLAGNHVSAEFRHRLVEKTLELPAEAGSTPNRVVVTLPKSTDAAADEWPAGSYSVVLRIEQNGKATRWTKPQSIMLVPRLQNVRTSGPANDPTLEVDLLPAVWPGQPLEIFVGGQALSPPKIFARTATVTVSLASVKRSDEPLPVRLRVDGAESQVVQDLTSELPQFDPTQSILLT